MISTFLMTYNKKFLRVGGSGNAHGSVCQPGNGPHFYFRRCSMTQENKHISNRIAFVLRLLKKSQKQLSIDAEIAENSVVNYLKGYRTPSLAMFGKIAKALHVKTEWLLTGVVSHVTDLTDFVILEDEPTLSKVVNDLCVTKEFVSAIVSGDLEPSDSFLSKLRTHYGISENADNHACGSSVTLKTIGEKIRHLRRIFGLSQVELAKSIGVKTAVAISKYESNLRVPDASKLYKIAKTFNVTLDWLLNNEAEDVEAFKTDIDTPIAKRLRLIREKYNISQRTAALRTGELQQNWARYETGTKIPHTFLYALRKTFFIDLNWFITGETPSVIEQAPINTHLKQLEECFASDISPQPESGKTGIPERPFLDPVNNVKKGRKSWRNAIVKLFSKRFVSEDI